MPKVNSGSIRCNVPAQMLETGSIVNGHKHNFDHTTFLMSGLWKIECFGEVYGPDGRPVVGKVKKMIPLGVGDDNRLIEEEREFEEPLLVKLREVTVKGGGPLSFILIEADKTHRLTLLEGPGCYICVYSHRDPDGQVSNQYTGWEQAYE